jgi:hypothetical protein
MAENFAKLEEKSSTEGSLYFVAFAPKDNPYFSGKWWLWSNHCWTYCQFNDRKIP